MPFWSKRDPAEEPDSGYNRLEQQIRWYDRKSGVAQRNYKWGYLVVVSSAAIPILVVMDFKVTSGTSQI